MNISTRTCPLTGGSFTAILDDEKMTVTSPITNDLHTYEIIDGMVLIPEDLFAYIPTMTPTDASKKLEVSLQRIDQLAKSGKLPPHYVCGNMRFLEPDVLRYQEQRKNGRPRKE